MPSRLASNPLGGSANAGTSSGFSTIGRVVPRLLSWPRLMGMARVTTNNPHSPTGSEHFNDLVIGVLLAQTVPCGGETSSDSGYCPDGFLRQRSNLAPGRLHRCRSSGHCYR